MYTIAHQQMKYPNVTWRIVLYDYLCTTFRYGRTVCYRQPGHAVINLPTKFEVPNFTPYGSMQFVAKCRKCGGLGWLVVAQAYRQRHHSIERIRLPIRL